MVYTIALIFIIAMYLLFRTLRQRAIIQQLTWKERLTALSTSIILFAAMAVGYHFVEIGISILAVTQFIHIVVWFVYCFIAICLIFVIFEKCWPKALLRAVLSRS